MELDQYMDEPRAQAFDFTPLNSTVNSPDETFGSIINNMMIDSWSSNVSFTSYYHACAPSTCTFENKHRMNIFLLVTTIVSIFGGLSLGLKVCMKIILEIWEKVMNGCHHTNSIRSCVIHDERQLTSRLNSLLLAITLCCLFVNSAFKSRLITVQILKPSLTTYEDLLQSYADTVQCSCSQISIQYESFVTIVPHFHQICSSDFVSNEWINYIQNRLNSTEPYDIDDWYYSADAQFQLLASICQLTQETVSSAIERLTANYLINIELLSRALLTKRIRMSIDQLQIISPNTFRRTFFLIREFVGTNMLLSGPSTNWVINIPHEIVEGGTVNMKPLTYNGCSCEQSSQCVESSRGMFVGCYALEALLKSKLACFYDQQCIDTSQVFQAMDSSSLLSSRFDSNSTIESLVAQLMIEEYTRNLSYEKYLEQCAASSCTYSYVLKRDMIVGITYLLGLYGGLLIICRI
ncbi:unnamed protein product [Adineta ricciae]|uniref:Uncharacterized protein n=1 Tax=Adineta ricciae TaxID=249248 RepID=A0A815DW36_ADIRI|nr:unnamed protein product [Adineta ricciae]